MADLTDALNAVVSLLAQALYPNGTGQPSATGDPITIYAGWPQSSQLDADLAGFGPGGKGGRVHVTVYPTGSDALQPAYSTSWSTLSQLRATVALTVAGRVVTLAGAVSTPQNVALIVNHLAYTYAVQAGDTLTSIATALAALIPGATNVGPVLTLPATASVQAARAGGSGVMQRELRRQKRPVQVTVWADTPGRRSAVAAAVDIALASLNFVALSDQTSARLMYQSSRDTDDLQKTNLYRRDIIYTAEYATTQNQSATEVVIGQESISLAGVGASLTAGSKTTYE